MLKLALAALLASTAGCDLALSAKIGNAHEIPDRPARFSILQVNDSYKIEGLENGSIGGFARLRALRRQLEAEGGEVLLLHGGDFLFPSVMSKYLRADAMVRVLNLLDGDASAFDDKLLVVFGNHEFDDPDPGLVLGRIAQSDFAWLSANTRYRSGGQSPGEPFSKRLTNVHESMVKEVGGIKVGLFGLTLDAQRPPYVEYDYSPESSRWARVKNTLARLKEQGAAVIVALTHQDFDQDQALARAFPEINLIVGGHEHFYIEKQIGNTWITKADADNKTAIVHQIEIQPGGAVATRHRKIDLDGNIEKDPQVQAEVEQQLDRLAKVFQKNGKDLRQVLGQTKYLLEGVEPAVRGRETALGNFLADVIRERMQADVAFTNGGGIRINDNIPPGPVTTYDMEGIFYYDNALASFELTGAELLDILRNAVSKSHLGDGRFLQISGIRFQYHAKETDGQPVYDIQAGDVEIKRWGGKGFAPLEPGKTYRAASTDFVWGKGYQDGYALFAQGAGKASPPRLDQGPAISFRKATEEAIAKLPGKTITNQIEGRIRRVE
jgi:5'-nucleotidase